MTVNLLANGEVSRSAKEDEEYLAMLATHRESRGCQSDPTQGYSNAGCR